MGFTHEDGRMGEGRESDLGIATAVAEQGCLNISRGRPDCTKCSQCDHAFPTVATLRKHESKDV